MVVESRDEHRAFETEVPEFAKQPDRVPGPQTLHVADIIPA